MNNLKFENVRVYNFENSLRGMRNPKNSWHLSDSAFGIAYADGFVPARNQVARAWAEKKLKEIDHAPYEKILNAMNDELTSNGIIHQDEINHCNEYAFIGPNDMKLAQTLLKAGPEHRKFLRQIFVTVDISAPLFWWKEFDTYKVGTVANSTSTMHKITSAPITRDCFKFDDELNDIFVNVAPVEYEEDELTKKANKFSDTIDLIIARCEDLRQAYLATQDVRYWKALIELLPEAWVQKRTVTMNYENLLAICSKSQRRFHKLSEWSTDFINWARTLPYAQYFIFADEEA